MTSADSNPDPGGTPVPADHDLVRLLTDWLPTQRWFAGKGRELGPIEVIGRVPIAVVRGDARIEHLLLAVPVGSAGVQTYQMFLGWHPWLPGALDRARIGSVGNWTAYDALHDGEVAAVLLRYLAEGREVSGLLFEPEPDPATPVDPTAPGLVIGAEQSNTSIVYGSSAILKVFRRLEPGPNPDAEVHRALWRAGCRNIAAPLGVISARLPGLAGTDGPAGTDTLTTLALMTTFFSGSAEGWAMATASVRDLMAEADLRADEVGGDFAAESYRLGKAVALIHADLATAFGTDEVTGNDLVAMMSDMAALADRTAADVPALQGNREAIRTAFDTAEALGTLTVQRIHGDLHLGQTLRTLTGWAIIDFEGEPSKPLAYRRSVQSPLKDVAGMLRSFDYAAHHSLVGGQPDAQHLFRATEWAERNRAAFCEGYASVSGSDPRDSAALLAAFELDKAVYEVGYEHGHRPAWEPIPLLAVSRLTRTGGRS